MTSHVGGIHLANLRMTERMAERAGDREFAQPVPHLAPAGQPIDGKQDVGRQVLPGNITNRRPGASRTTSSPISSMASGWRGSRPPGVFRPDRVKQSLATIGALAARSPVGRGEHGHPRRRACRRASATARMPTSLRKIFMLAMTYLYNGDGRPVWRPPGACLHSLTITTGRVWNQPKSWMGQTARAVRQSLRPEHDALGSAGSLEAKGHRLILRERRPGTA